MRASYDGYHLRWLANLRYMGEGVYSLGLYWSEGGIRVFFRLLFSIGVKGVFGFSLGFYWSEGDIRVFFGLLLK